MNYSSVDNPKIKEIKKLQNKKHRDKKELFIIEGKHLVLEAYKKGYLKTLILEENEIFPLNIDTMYVTNNVINYLSSLDTPSMIMGVCQKPKPNEMLGDKIVVLDNVQDPGNLGTIVRSCVAFNIDTLILSEETVDLYNPKVIRACQGLNFHLNIIRDDIVKKIIELKTQEIPILGTKVIGGTSLKDINNLNKFALIMGNEGSGISEHIEELCDKFIYIDMNDMCESLNVAVATSIILYELGR